MLRVTSVVRYVAFLRGINVGGYQKIKMSQLQTIFHGCGFENVKTVLASGNVLFEAIGDEEDAIAKTTEAAFEQSQGYTVSIIIRSLTEIQELIASQPFKDIELTKDRRLYITFLPRGTKNTFPIPYQSPENDFVILSKSNDTLCSVLTLSASRNTTDAMKIIEKEFGKKVTTRNWNTLLKIAKL